jgi:site-specific DNA-methyltransferase (adenine-specific)
MWQELERVGRDDGAIILTASQPFTSELIHSNIAHFRHSWVWDKGLSGNIFLASSQPMKIHEDVLVFAKSTPRYFPQKVSGEIRKMRNNGMNDSAFGSFENYEGGESGERNPKSILYFPNTDRKSIQHPTQKPSSLFGYLVATYSEEGDTVLDPFCGSCTTAVACVQLKRNYICIEKEEKYVKICNERLNATSKPLF